ncbi:PAS domain-containing protein [Haladaptatus sp. NG-WS-4]
MSSSGSSGDVYAETLTVFDRRDDPSEPLTTPEVADTLNLARRTVYKRLEKLVSRGDLKTKKAGANARVWWRSLDGSANVAHPSDIGPRRSELELAVEEVLEQITDGFYGLDEQSRFTYVNNRAEDLLDLEESAVLGRDIHDELMLTDEFEAAIHEAHETQEPAFLEDYYDPLDAWFENVIYPSESGLSVYFQDISERKHLEHDLQIDEEHFRTVLENSPLVAFRLDTDLRYTWIANPHEDFDPDAVIGKRDDELLPPDAAESIMAPKRRALETGERVREEVTYELPSGQVSYDLTVAPLRDETGKIVGLTAASLDITESKKAEESLRKSEERLRLALEARELGVWELDLQTEESPIRSPLHDRIFGYDELEGWSFEQFIDHVHPEDRERVRQSFDEAFEAGEWTFECRIIRTDDSQRWITAQGEFYYDEGEPIRVVGVVQDITESKERERELEEYRRQYRTLIENFPSGAVALVDQDFRYVAFGGTPEGKTDVTRADLEGELVRDVLPPQIAEVVVPRYEAALNGEASAFEDTINDRIYQFHFLPVRDDQGEVFAVTAMSQDITDRKRRERELDESKNRYQALVENFPNGLVTLFDEDLRYLIAGGQLYETLGRDPAETVEQTLYERATPEQIEILEPHYRAALNGDLHSFEIEQEGQALTVWTVPVTDEGGDVFAGMAMFQDITELKERQRELEESQRRSQTIVDNFPNGIVTLFDEDLRYLVAGGQLYEAFDRSPNEAVGKTLHERSKSEEIEILEPAYNAALDGEASSFEIEYGDWVLKFHIVPVTDEEGTVFAGLAMSQDITERKRREEELAALNRLNQVFQEITHAVIESSTREEIERTITDHLTNSDSYEFAWVGHLDRLGENILPQIAEQDDGSLSEVILSTATDDSTSYGLVTKAMRTGEVQVTYESSSDPIFDQWKQSREVQSRAEISIPITYEDRVYGVLTIHTARENAFNESERRLIGRLGEIVGHAINAIERKRALLEDRVQEITFKSQRFAEIFTDAADDESFTISIEKFVPLPDDQSIAYYSLDGLDPAVFTDVIETFNPNAEYRVTDEEGSRVRVEVQQSSLALASKLAKYNSWIADGTLQNGEFRLRVHVPEHSHVRGVKDVVKEAYPDVEVVAQTEVERESPRLSDVFSALNDQLTERQRTTLEVAYYSGFFDWPRTITGEELAERLDVTQGTVSHHLRHGERKLMEAFFKLTA